jgi:tetratricopeptide (TPR) repeat protein
VSSYHFANLGSAYLDAGQYASAEETLRVYQVMEPDDQSWPTWQLGLALLLQSKTSEALQHFEENFAEDHPLRFHGKTLALHDLGRPDDAAAELARLLEVDPQPAIDWVIGTAYAWLGAKDEAFNYFEKQRQKGLMAFTSMAASPLYANLRDDPRWQPFLASVGVDPEFLSSIEFNPRLPAEIRLP